MECSLASDADFRTSNHIAVAGLNHSNDKLDPNIPRFLPTSAFCFAIIDKYPPNTGASLAISAEL